MTANALPMGGYIRVSYVGGREGDTFMSPGLQRDVIERWSERSGVPVNDIREELDVSGGKRDRPELEDLVAETVAGRLGGIVVARIDRFTRNVAYGADVIERVVKAGGTVIGADDGTDARTRNGRLMVQMMMALGEHQLEGHREGTRSALTKKIEQGKHVGPYVPAGYIRNGGYLTPDPVWGPRMTEAFRRRGTGASRAEIAQWLHGLGLRTGKGGALTAGWVQRTFASRVYLGEVTITRLTNRNAHEPLIDEVTWLRANKTNGPRVPSDSGQLLSGLVRCSGCRYAMAKAATSPYADGQRRALWACRPHRPGGRCQTPTTIRCDTLESHVMDLFWARVEGLALRSERLPTGNRETEAETAVAAARTEFEMYRDTPGLLTSLGAEEYAAGLSVKRATLLAAEQRLADLRVAGPPMTAVQTQSLRTSWPEMPIGVRRAVLAAEFAAVVVSRSTAPRNQQQISGRVRVLLTGHDDAVVLPRRGGTGLPVTPFEVGHPPDAWLPL